LHVSFQIAIDDGKSRLTEREHKQLLLRTTTHLLVARTDKMHNTPLKRGESEYLML